MGGVRGVCLAPALRVVRLWARLRGVSLLSERAAGAFSLLPVLAWTFGPAAQPAACGCALNRAVQASLFILALPLGITALRAAGTWVRHPPAAAAWQRFGRGCGRVSPKQLTTLVVRTGFRLCVSCVHLLVTRVGGCLPSLPPSLLPVWTWVCCCPSGRTPGGFLCVPFLWVGAVVGLLKGKLQSLLHPVPVTGLGSVGVGSARPLVLLAPPRRCPRGCVAAPPGGGVRGLLSPLGRPCTFVLGRPMRRPRGVRASLPARPRPLPLVRPPWAGAGLLFWVGGSFCGGGAWVRWRSFCSRGVGGPWLLPGRTGSVGLRFAGVGVGCGFWRAAGPLLAVPPSALLSCFVGGGLGRFGFFLPVPLWGRRLFFRFACPACPKSSKIIKNFVFIWFSVLLDAVIVSAR